MSSPISTLWRPLLSPESITGWPVRFSVRARAIDRRNKPAIDRLVRRGGGRAPSLSALVIPRGNMFQHRASDFSPSVAVIQKHLGVVEKELEKIGRIARRRTSDPPASDQIGDAISTILREMVDRCRQGG